jgi:uncharacterized protein YjiS (DUF1127 family)
MSHIPEDAAGYGASASSSILDLPGKILAAAFAAVAQWMRNAHERAQLADLDDYMLADIGLTRRDVERIVNQPFWRS